HRCTARTHGGGGFTPSSTHARTGRSRTMSEQEPNAMRVSDWAKPAPAGGQPQVPFIAPLTAANPPGESAAPSPAPQPPASSLPVDPWRLLGGLLKRKYWIIIALVLGAGLGLTWGLLKARTRYLVTVQLIKQELPSAFRVSEVGEAFRPQ